MNTLSRVVEGTARRNPATCAKFAQGAKSGVERRKIREQAEKKLPKGRFFYAAIKTERN